MNIHTVQFAHILETSDLDNLHPFLSRTAFVISHKSESIETLLRVLWYIPIDSTIIIVTNCPQEERNHLAQELKTHLVQHKNTYLVHQKDGHIAHLFKTHGVQQILGADGRVVNGKGEGMYIGALCAHQLDHPRWLIFYDADNFVPSALLEYTVAMSRLFLSPTLATNCRDCAFPPADTSAMHEITPDLFNVRICWSSKPESPENGDWKPGIMGRTTQVVSPLFDSLLAEWFDIHDHTIRSSNAGEQGMTIKTATSLRFSSGFSVETFQLLDLLAHALEQRETSRDIVLRQYLSKSPHFHEKKGDEHIKKMIEESLGGFSHFDALLSSKIKRQLEQICSELQIEQVGPVVYPALRTLSLQKNELSMERYALFVETDYREEPASIESMLAESVPIESMLSEGVLADAIPIEPADFALIEFTPIESVGVEFALAEPEPVASMSLGYALAESEPVEATPLESILTDSEGYN